MAAANSSSLSRQETWRLFALVGACVGILLNTFQGDGAPLVASLAFSGIAFAVTFSMIRWLVPVFLKAGLKGRDMAKPRRPEIPETMGAVCAIVYLLALIFFIPFAFYKDIVAATSGGGNRDVVIEVEHVETGRMLHRFPHGKLASYLSGLLSLQCIVILGIGDDLLDIRWRHKVLIPAFGAIPMLIVYFVDFGVTQVVVPVPLQPYLGSTIDLGWLYYAYMAAVAIFCPNSINMLAGINGVEVAQSLVIAVLLIANDVLYLAPITPYPHPATDSHLFSLYFLLPFVGVSAALLCHNWYPSKVFVGDTYCYFAGMVFAVVGILGHFSKTLLLLFIPQIFNFLYSTPQLFNLIPCPRHRLPKFNSVTGLLDASVTEWTVPPSPLVATALNLLHTLRLVRVTKNEQGQIVESTNLTILNLWLVWAGPMKENQLAWSMVAVQTFCGLAGLFVRHRLALLVFREDNLAFGSSV
ncbi:UDP-N-acetylglucosamine--dolichyl-phosphate N-acetylglucosaminephosphotransferase [Aspergillus luchuensis]|uniref:UDP-N-acetylglucosamine--dolichyl-phosphate N-acetylglucosaminephosphotransferase n=2 Tax=Aspergillus subgen. Circumdati TaxID=2720871 RepID=A0A146FLF9_ASPKA|nr:UDP-N-acetylglucosamine-dolichyl-phosphate N-acetylglucosaminephosphate transferase [Aspergillus piperis CBS 112811]XP_041540172.1 tunicamycin resistance protein [Aspergillus luchuensis]GAA82349.1 UDP-N-acetylglucosamine-dolichyl-phosphate N-acetylglucosaminephosphate transferase [Aspergillus luchuensis IFO 4308]RAH59799.1 UDP-N-acetylglucosamine-dolichyl-phosphate N-acetylglucosaminephosphate transferase [Aspergillus piperis CBS 112811]BCR96406.1 tunicamycin resistance protein [Aspergillus 